MSFMLPFGLIVLEDRGHPSNISQSNKNSFHNEYGSIVGKGRACSAEGNLVCPVICFRSCCIPEKPSCFFRNGGRLEMKSNCIPSISIFSP
jgi:hypothetical protein